MRTFHHQEGKEQAISTVIDPLLAFSTRVLSFPFSMISDPFADCNEQNMLVGILEYITFTITNRDPYTTIGDLK